MYFILFDSESTSEGRRVTKLDKILLNGNNITMVSKSCSHFFNSNSKKKKNDFDQSDFNVTW